MISSCQLSVNPALVCFLNSCSQEENAVELSGAWELRWFYCKYSRQSKIDGSESNILKGNLMAISPFLSSSERGAAPLNGRIKGTERNEEAARWVEGGRGLAAPARSWSWRRLLRALCSSTCVRRSCDLPGRAVVARNGGLKLPSLQGSAPLISTRSRLCSRQCSARGSQVCGSFWGSGRPRPAAQHCPEVLWTALLRQADQLLGQGSGPACAGRASTNCPGL